MKTTKAIDLAEANRGNESKVFDWDKAARLIKEHRSLNARAGLRGDWEFTGGDILRDGIPVPRSETYCYLASNWATPELEIDGLIVECYQMKSETPGWDAHTYWPESAREALSV